MIRMDHNAGVVAADLAKEGFQAGVKAQATVAHFGLLLQSEVKRNASLPRTGPPGPRLQTGDYVRSITLRVGVLSADVGTNKPQARRLEFGFEGVDALGRYYDQPPYPHFGPAMDTIGPAFVAALAASLGGTL